MTSNSRREGKITQWPDIGARVPEQPSNEVLYKCSTVEMKTASYDMVFGIFKIGKRAGKSKWS